MMAWQRTRIDVDPDLSPDEREALADEVIDFIIKRSKKGKGIHTKFPKYSKEYAKKKGQTNVDLTLSDEMLQEIELLSSKKGSILIGYRNGTEVNAKAEGNQTGSYGRSPNASKARPFLGLSGKDMDLIAKKFEG